jgi:uncharacterized protein (TIRG00374 family)
MKALLRNRRVWLGLAVSAVALYFALRGIAWADIRRALASASYTWLIPAIGVIVVGQVARAIRWQVLFGDGPRPDLRSAFAILSVGYLVSAVFPLRLGDVVRAWLVETRTPAGGFEAFATILVERALDLLVVLILLTVWVPTPAARFLGGQLGPGLWADAGSLRLAALAVVVAVYLAMIGLALIGPRLGRRIRRLLVRCRVPDPVAEAVAVATTRFAAGFAPLRQPRTAALALAWSLGVWWVGGVGYWLMMRAFHLDLPFSAAVFAMCATALLAILPSSPGYVGVFHWGIRLALAIYGAVPAAVAISYALVLHGVTILVLIALGLLGMWLLGLSRRQLDVGMGAMGEPAGSSAR